MCSKPGGNFLELGTGIGLSLSWMIEGMDDLSRLISVDNDPQLIEIAHSCYRLDFLEAILGWSCCVWMEPNG